MPVGTYTQSEAHLSSSGFPLRPFHHSPAVALRTRHCAISQSQRSVRLDPGDFVRAASTVRCQRLRRRRSRRSPGHRRRRCSHRRGWQKHPSAQRFVTPREELQRIGLEEHQPWRVNKSHYIENSRLCQHCERRHQENGRGVPGNSCRLAGEEPRHTQQR